MHLIMVGLAGGSIFLDCHAYEWYLPFPFSSLPLCLFPITGKGVEGDGDETFLQLQDTLQ